MSKKITINLTRAEANFEFAKSDDFIATAHENLVRRGSAIFHLLAGKVEIYACEREATRVMNAQWAHAQAFSTPFCDLDLALL